MRTIPNYPRVLVTIIVVLIVQFHWAAAQSTPAEKPATNIKDAQKYPRTSLSMPGKYPGKVVQVHHDKCVIDNKFQQVVIDEMLTKGMLGLTGVKDVQTAWRMFVDTTDIIGLKVNPVAGVQLSTSLEIVKAVIQQLEKAGIPKNHIVIWDRREFELHEVGFVDANFPGIKILGTERKDSAGSFYDASGKMYGKEMIDTNWYYWADVEDKYDAETLPYMINEGKYSYFSKIVTQQVDKIINIPILKNAGSSITLCLKNLAYGSISNTGRLHKQLWSETIAEVCAFPPLRDKVVLNIVDGIRGCYNGGPGANAEFITEFKTILIGTDPVAVDRIGYNIILKKRIDEKIQKEESPKGKLFLELAQNLNLGIADTSMIKFEKIEMP
jgi:hypothetical protein